MECFGDSGSECAQAESLCHLHAAVVVVVAMLLMRPCAAQQDSLLQRAQQLDLAGRCGEAQALYEQALGSGSTPAVLNNFGTHYLACNQPEKAEEIFRRLLVMNPAHANANLQLARLALEQHEPAKALGYLNHIPKPDAEAQIARAEALAGTGRRDEAQRILTGVESGPEAARDVRVLYAAGMACARAGFYAMAERALSRVLAKDPDDADVLFNLGVAAGRAGHFDRARDAFSAVLKAQPNNADALFELGRAEASAGDYKRAIFLLAQAKKAKPGNADVELALARATEMGGYYGDAIAAYDDYLSLRPQDETARRDRALVAAFTRAQHEQGARDLAAWVEKHPNDAMGHYDLALVKSQNDRPGALEQASRAIALDPSLEPARYFRGWVLQQNGAYEESLRDAQAAVRLKPKDAKALDLLGLDYLDLSRAAEAEPVLRKAIEIAPNDADITFHLARSLIEAGRRDEAQPLMARFQKLRRETPEGPREQPGIVEAATLPPQELAKRVAAEYREAATANPNDPVVRLRFAESLVAADRKEEAQKAFRDLLALSPPANVARDAGLALLADEQYPLGAEFLRSATAEIPSAWIDLAMAEFFASGPEAALKALESAPANVDRGDYHVMRARILEAAGKPSEAIAEIRKGEESAISRPRLASEAAAILMRHGEPKQALELTDRAIRSAPDDRLLLLTRVAALAAARSRQAESAARALESRWPEWDRPYVAEALLLASAGQYGQAKARFAIAEALGSDDAITSCARERVAGAKAPCACDAGIWAGFTGCSESAPANASSSK